MFMRLQLLLLPRLASQTDRHCSFLCFLQATADDTFSHLRGAEGKRDRKLSHDADEPIVLGACEDFAVMAASTATCAGAPSCDIVGGYLGVYPGTSSTGNFAGDIVSTEDITAPCAEDGLAAWNVGRAMTSEEPSMPAEMGGVTFSPGVHTNESPITVAANREVYLDANGDSSAVFIFNAALTLTTGANSEIVLLNGAKKENVFWILGTALTMGADSTLVGNVLAGSAITIGTNAQIKGRAIAQTAVTCETACKIETSTGGAPSEGEEKLKETPNVPLEAVGGVIQDEYLIYHDKGVDPRALLADFINSGDAEILHEYTLMNAFLVHMKRELLDVALKTIENFEVFDNPVMSAIEMDSPVYAWGVDRTDQATGRDNQYQYERDGTNVDVYILDTGIYVGNDQFEGRASLGLDVTGEGNYDGHGHGTHVAGTLH
jgi:hypothetical protein